MIPLNTVSKAYAKEIQTEEYGFGLDGLLRRRADVLTGILNGVDSEEWNPEKDAYIACPYDSNDLRRQTSLQTGSSGDVWFAHPVGWIQPVVGIVSRFVDQKGFDLIEAIADDLAHENLLMTIIGTGEPRYEEMFQQLAQKYTEKISVRVTYSDELAHKIEAGADLFLMPSRYEPCGLNQIYSLKKNTAPFQSCGRPGGWMIPSMTGTVSSSTSTWVRRFLEAIRTALSAYGNKVRWETL